MAGFGGFFAGGLAEGVQDEQKILGQQNYQQGLLKLEQQRLAQAQQRDQQAMYMDLRAQAVKHLDETMTQIRIHDPKLTSLQLASNPAVLALKDSISTLDKNLGLPNTIDSIIASIASRPSEAETTRIMTEAKEGPMGLQEKLAKTNRDRALAGQPLIDATGKEIQPNPDVPGHGSPEGPGMGGSAESLVKNKYDARTIFKAEQLLGGNTAVLSGLGYRGSAGQERKKIQDAAADLAIARGMSPEQVNAEVAKFMGEKRAASAAGLRVGNVTVAMDAAQAASTRVLETSDKVDRTQYPSINSIILAVQKGTGDPSVVQFGIAVNTLVNNYARAVGGGNAQLTDTARKEAWDNLNTAWSKGQINAAVEQINKEIASELSGAQKALKDVTGKKSETPPPPPGFILGQ